MVPKAQSDLRHGIAVRVGEESYAIGTHPRLMVVRGSFAELNARIGRDAVASVLFRFLERRAEDHLSAPDAVYQVEGRRLLGVSRRVLEEVLTCSLLARLTGERKYVDAARRQMLAAAAFPDWNPSHFLDTGEMATAVAIGYDWLFDDLSASDRGVLEAALIDKAIKPSLEVEGAWVTASTNWNPVCHGGMTLAALAVGDREPELASRVIARALENVPRIAPAYGPDGAYDEGPSYWIYGTSYLVILWAALESALGMVCRLEVPGVLASADYMMHAAGPSGLFYNYSDCRSERPVISALFWLAGKAGRPELANIDQRLLRSLVSWADHSEPDRLLPLALLWHRPIASDLPVENPPRVFVGGGRTPVALMRSDWSDPSATFVGIKGGSPSTSHAHMDVGSFVLEAGGVRWAIDLPQENYHTIESAGLHLWDMSQGSDRWSVFRIGAEGHGILRFGGGAQAVGGFGTLRELNASNAIGRVEIDLSTLYPGVASSVKRSATLHCDGSVQITDGWSALGQPIAVSWQMVTPARVEVSERGFVLRSQEKSLEVRFAHEGGQLEKTIEDVSQLVRSYDSPNPGISRISVRLTTEPQSAGRLTTRFVLG